MPTGRVQLICVRMRASKKSLYASSKVNKPVVMMPGHMIGTMTETKERRRPAPSIMAASSISRGISMKKLRSIQIVKG